MGRKLILTGTKLTNSSAPKLPDVDVIMPDAGALLFIDPSHPYKPWSRPVSNSSALPNLASKQAQALIPSADETTLAPILRIDSTFLPAGVAERSSKGGLHLMPSQATLGDAASVAGVVTGTGAAPLNQYLRTNTAHRYYIALWGKITRSAKAWSAGTGNHLHSRSDGSQQVYGFFNRASGGDTQYPVDSRRLGHYGEGVAPAVGGIDFYQEIAVAPTASSNAALEPLLVGNISAATEYGKSAGFLLYGYYLEDLTVSGRDYPAVSALVRAKYARDVKSTTGRYYGDSYTTRP